MAQRGNIYSALYQSDSDVEEDDTKRDDTLEIDRDETRKSFLRAKNDLMIALMRDINSMFKNSVDDKPAIPITPVVIHPASPPLERITHTSWRTEMIYQSIVWLGRDAIEIIAAYATHTEAERFVCVLEDISRRGFNNIIIGVDWRYFETPLKLEWLGGSDLPYDCKQYRLTVKCANSGRCLNIEGAFEDVLPSNKHLFGLTMNAENKKENRKLRIAYRQKMIELFTRY